MSLRNLRSRGRDLLDMDAAERLLLVLIPLQTSLSDDPRKMNNACVALEITRVFAIR